MQLPSKLHFEDQPHTLPQSVRFFCGQGSKSSFLLRPGPTVA